MQPETCSGLQMPLSLLILPILAGAAATPAERPIFVTGNVWAPFISPMGEPFRSHQAGDDTLANWFNQADRNHDGMLTASEMVSDADRFFALLDTNHDGEIDPDELVNYEWRIAPEIQVMSSQPFGSTITMSASGTAKAIPEASPPPPQGITIRRGGRPS